MAYINLLPWREEAQKTKEREYYTILGLVAFIAFTIVFLINQFFQMRIDGQNARNQYLLNEIKILDIRIGEIKTLNDKKNALQQRISVVEQLQRSRNVGTQVLDEISKIVPAGVYLIRLEKQGNSIQILGKSESNNHLANMIREIEGSDLFTDAILESITTDEAKSKLLSDFKMRIKIKGLVEEADSQVNAAQGGK